MQMRNIAIASLLGTIGVTISAIADDGHVFRYPIFYGSSEIGSGNENIVIVTPPYNITFNVDKTNTEGKADSGDVVYVYDEGGGLIGGGTVDSNGTFSISISPALTGGDKVIYVAENNDGIKSKEVVVTIPDYTNVDLTEPYDITFKENGSIVSGKADPNISIVIEDDSGNVIGTGVTDNNGNFNISIIPSVSGGDNIILRSKDNSGNISDDVLITVPSDLSTDLTEPSDIIFDESGDSVSGVADPDITIIVEDDSGNTIGTGVTDNNGDFNISVTPPVTGGDNVILRSENGSGDESNNVSVTVPENVGELACDPSALVEGRAYDNVCGLESLDLTNPAYYAGVYNGEMYFLSPKIGNFPKIVGASGSSPNGYNNTVSLYSKHGNQADYYYNYAAKKCYLLDDRVGWFLPSHVELASTVFTFVDGLRTQVPWASKLGIQKSPNARLVMSDRATYYSGMYLVANNNGEAKNLSFEGESGETLCAITPSSIQGEK